MTTRGDGAAGKPDRTSERPLSFGASADEPRARFRAQGRPGPMESRRRDVRQARRMYGAFAGLAAVICLVLIAVRLGRGDAVGVWVATCAAGVVVGGSGAMPARIGRIRWATAVTCVVAAASLGAGPALG